MAPSRRTWYYIQAFIILGVICLIMVTIYNNKGFTIHVHTSTRTLPITIPLDDEMFETHTEQWADEYHSFDEEFKRFQTYIHIPLIKCNCMRSMGGNLMFIGHDAHLDGEYKVCIEPELIDPNNCLVYSAGISKDWSFDEDMEKFGCDVYSMDPFIGLQDHKHSEKIHFLNVGVSDKNFPENRTTSVKNWRTLNGLIKELGHEERIIDVLKIDVEGSEYTVLPAWLKDGSLHRKVVQFIVEFHYVGHQDRSPGAAKRIHDAYTILKWMELQGFVLFNQRINEDWRAGQELAFINTFFRGSTK